MLDFDGIMQVAQELNLPSPPDVDSLTDEIASGAKTEAELAEEWGAIAMHFSPLLGDLDKIKSLVTHGVDVNVLGPKDSCTATWTPLHVAAEYNQPKAAQLLIDLGAKLEAKDGGGPGDPGDDFVKSKAMGMLGAILRGDGAEDVIPAVADALCESVGAAAEQGHMGFLILISRKISQWLSPGGLDDKDAKIDLRGTMRTKAFTNELVKHGAVKTFAKVGKIFDLLPKMMSGEDEDDIAPTTSSAPPTESMRRQHTGVGRMPTRVGKGRAGRRVLSTDAAQVRARITD